MEIIQSLLAEIDFDTNTFIKAAILLAVGCILFGVFGRFIFGKRSALNHAVSSAIGILFVYAATIALHSAGVEFRSLLAPLPFISISNENLKIFSFIGSDYTVICSEVLSMVILAFLANLLDTIVPRGKNLITWLICRCITVVLAMALHMIVTQLFNTYLPEGLVIYSPTILLALLVILLLVGALKIVVGAVLATVNPLIAAFYTFFFATIVGKALTKAMLTATLLSLLVYGLNYIGCTVISIASAALIAYIPFLLILLVIWYVASRVL